MPTETCREDSPETRFLGLEFSNLSMAGVIAEVRRRALDPAFSYIVTANVDHVVKLFPRRLKTNTLAFRAAYDNAALRLCDSRILKRLGSLMGIRLPVVPGSDLTAVLIRTIFSKDERIAIIGGGEHTIPALEQCFPGPEYIQHIPPMGVLGNEQAMLDIVNFITSRRAHVTLFAIGAPQSEIIAARCKAHGASGVGICVGASIDFLTGDQRRAPPWIQRAGMEWAYRLLGNPGRLWRRYLIEGPWIFCLFALQRWLIPARAGRGAQGGLAPD